MKNRVYFFLGLFFIWVIPIVLLIIMAFNGKTDGIKIKTWVSVALVVMAFIYYFRGKDALSRAKERQLIKKDYVEWWVRVIEWLVCMIPFTAFLLVIENIKTNIDETILFITLCMVSVSIGYIFMVADSKINEKLKHEENVKLGKELPKETKKSKKKGKGK